MRVEDCVVGMRKGGRRDERGGRGKRDHEGVS